MDTREKITNLLLEHSGSIFNFTEMKGYIDKLHQTIESLKCCGNCNNKPYAGGIGEIEPRCCLEDDCISNSKWQPIN